MFPRAYYERTRPWDTRSIVLGVLDRVEETMDARSKGPFSSVKTCAIGVSRPSSGHGKSPCFSRSCLLRSIGVVQAALVLHAVDVGGFDV